MLCGVCGVNEKKTEISQINKKFLGVHFIYNFSHVGCGSQKINLTGFEDWPKVSPDIVDS